MNDWQRVTAALWRIYRPIGLWFWGVITLCLITIDLLVNGFAEQQASLWLLVAGSAAKYWPAVVGVLLVALQLRSFLANGVTRRHFLAGSAVFGLLVAVAFALLVPIGHGIEYALLSLDGPVAANYPAFSATVALAEFGHALPTELAYLVTGAAISAGYYRFGAWGGLFLMLPGLLPMAVAEGLFGLDDHGTVVTRLLPYGLALLASLAITALVGLLFRQVMRDVPIRRATG
jgi:hypothetical protein